MPHDVIHRELPDHAAVDRKGRIAVDAAGLITRHIQLVDRAAVDRDLRVRHAAAVDRAAEQHINLAAVYRDVRCALKHDTRCAAAGPCDGMVFAALDRHMRIKPQLHIFGECFLISADDINLCRSGIDALPHDDLIEATGDAEALACAVAQRQMLKGRFAWTRHIEAVCRIARHDQRPAGDSHITLVLRHLKDLTNRVCIRDDDLTAVSDLADRFGHVTER